MSRFDIIRAWKNATVRQSLSAAERALLPENPAGAVELTEAEAEVVEGRLAARGCQTCHTSCNGACPAF